MILESSLLILNLCNFPDDYSAEAWNSAWDIDEPQEEKLNEIVKLKREDQSWLQDCISSLSPAADVLALGYGQHAVFFTCKFSTY